MKGLERSDSHEPIAIVGIGCRFPGNINGSEERITKNVIAELGFEIDDFVTFKCWRKRKKDRKPYYYIAELKEITARFSQKVNAKTRKFLSKARMNGKEVNPVSTRKNKLSAF